VLPIESTDSRCVSITARNDRFFDSYVLGVSSNADTDRSEFCHACDDLCAQIFPTVPSRSEMKPSGAISGSFVRAGRPLAEKLSQQVFAFARSICSTSCRGRGARSLKHETACSRNATALRIRRYDVTKHTGDENKFRPLHRVRPADNASADRCRFTKTRRSA
jgi:hypothetical protein